MNTSVIRKVKQYVGKMIRSNSPVFYRIYKHTKGFYLVCWCCWNFEDRPTQKNWFTIFMYRREIHKVLAILNNPSCIIVDTDFLPQDFQGFDQIKAISLRKQEGINVLSKKKFSNWVVLTKTEDELGVNYSYPYSNSFKSQEHALRRANDWMKYILPLNPKVEVILESPINGNDFWRNLETARKIAHDAQENKMSHLGEPQGLL